MLLYMEYYILLQTKYNRRILASQDTIPIFTSKIINDTYAYIRYMPVHCMVPQMERDKSVDVYYFL